MNDRGVAESHSLERRGIVEELFASVQEASVGREVAAAPGKRPAEKPHCIAERERAVVELEEMIVKRSTDLDRVRQEVEDRIAEWSSQGRDRVTQLADVYSAMPPEKAGRLLDKLDLDLAVSVVRKMKKKSSAAVLGAMRSDRALLVSRRMLKPLDPSSDAPAARAR